MNFLIDFALLTKKGLSALYFICRVHVYVHVAVYGRYLLGVYEYALCKYEIYFFDVPVNALHFMAPIGHWCIQDTNQSIWLLFNSILMADFVCVWMDGWMNASS